MTNRQETGVLEKAVKRLAKSLENKADIEQYQELLFGLLFLKFVAQFRDHGLDVPVEFQWQQLRSKAGSPYFGEIVINALEAVEDANPKLRGAFGLLERKRIIDRHLLAPLVEFIDSLPIDVSHSMDLFGRIYEYLHTGKSNRQDGIFLTPDCIAKLLAEMLQPAHGKIYDPCCGSGGMFIHAVNYAKSHNHCLGNLSFYGQESNPTLFQICRLNLALHGIKNSDIRWNPNGSLFEDTFPGLKVDFIFTNPPFNQKTWGEKELEGDQRWRFGTPPPGNGNFAWLQHVISHLTPRGRAAVLLPNGSATTLTPAESSIRQKLVEAGMVECVIGLPDRLFLNTSVPACVWVLSL